MEKVGNGAVDVGLIGEEGSVGKEMEESCLCMDSMSGSGAVGPASGCVEQGEDVLGLLMRC